MMNKGHLAIVKVVKRRRRGIENLLEGTVSFSLKT